MTNNHEIKTMTVIDAPENQVGNRLLAIFDILSSGIMIRGCVLLRKSGGQLVAKGPIGKNHVGGAIRAEFVDTEVKDAIASKAARAYAALTGREAPDE
ncbi:hypothetical protein QO231_18150 [Sedimentitalea todarodis]|uniref:PilZ domain-containing protein n=2 Tax=Sedimentitalea todarodis TaxID=1631240 RepID=A0ABU3VHV1_9RHOB|nr:hypothetical protein [Sedimentitalea todarodis]